MAVDSAIDAALAALQRTDGRSIVYRRGSDAVTLIATRGSAQFQLLTQGGAAELLVCDAWYIPSALLVLSTGRTLPQRGDRITETIGAITTIDEVMDPAPGIPHYAAFGHGKLLRVHTKRVSTA